MAVGLWHWKIAHYKILLGFSEENDRTKDFIAFAIKENGIRLRANKVAVLCYFCFLGYIFAKGSLISESFSLWVQSLKNIPNH